MPNNYMKEWNENKMLFLEGCKRRNRRMHSPLLETSQHSLNITLLCMTLWSEEAKGELSRPTYHFAMYDIIVGRGQRRIKPTHCFHKLRWWKFEESGKVYVKRTKFFVIKDQIPKEKEQRSNQKRNQNALEAITYRTISSLKIMFWNRSRYPLNKDSR